MCTVGSLAEYAFSHILKGVQNKSCRTYHVAYRVNIILVQKLLKRTRLLKCAKKKL